MLKIIIIFFALTISTGAIAGDLHLYTDKGEYRGKLSKNPYDSNSTSNPYGKYGSRYSSDSINNPYGAGSKYKRESPNNPYGTGLEIREDRGSNGELRERLRR